MTCTKCGANVPGNSAYCPVCGEKVAEVVQPVADYVPKHASQEPAYHSSYQAPVWDNVQQNTPAAQPDGKSGICPQCGKPLEAGITFCGACGYRLNAPAARAPHAAQPRKKTNYAAVAGKTKVWVPIVAGVALILVVALVIGMLSSLGGPLVKIGAAAKKTVQSGNFTADYEVEVDGVSIEGTMFADIDVKDRTVSMYTVLEGDGAEITFGIYDGYAFYIMDSYGYSYSDTQDIEDELDEIFDAYEETGSSDLTEVLEQIDELMYDYTGEELSDYFDLEELEKCLKAYSKAVAKEKWLKENMGYSKEKVKGETLYTFEPSLYEFAVASLPYFESSFEDSDLYDEAMEALDDYGDDLDDEFSVEYTLGVKSGYLSTISMVIEVEGEEVEATVKIYDVNKTKLDEAELAEMLEDAE